MNVESNILGLLGLSQKKATPAVLDSSVLIPPVIHPTLSASYPLTGLLLPTTPPGDQQSGVWSSQISRTNLAGTAVTLGTLTRGVFAFWIDISFATNYVGLLGAPDFTLSLNSPTGGASNITFVSFITPSLANISQKYTGSTPAFTFIDEGWLIVNNFGTVGAAQTMDLSITVIAIRLL